MLLRFSETAQNAKIEVFGSLRLPPPPLQAAFNKIPSGGPLLPLLNGALVLGAVGYCGYNSVFTGEESAVSSPCCSSLQQLSVKVVEAVCHFPQSSQQEGTVGRLLAYHTKFGLFSCATPAVGMWLSANAVRDG